MVSTEAEDFMNNYDKDDQENHNETEIREEKSNLSRFEEDINEILEEVKKLELKTPEERDAPTDFTNILKKNERSKKERQMYGCTKEN